MAGVIPGGVKEAYYAGDAVVNHKPLQAALSKSDVDLARRVYNAIEKARKVDAIAADGAISGTIRVTKSALFAAASKSPEFIVDVIRNGKTQADIWPRNRSVKRRNDKDSKAVSAAADHARDLKAVIEYRQEDADVEIESAVSGCLTAINSVIERYAQFLPSGKMKHIRDNARCCMKNAVQHIGSN